MSNAPMTMILLLGSVFIGQTGPREARRHSALAVAEKPADSLAKVTLRVEGMTCGGCVIGVRTVLSRLPGVQKAEVSYETKSAIVDYDPTKVTVARMIEAIGTLHYVATVADSGRRATTRG